MSNDWDPKDPGEVVDYETDFVDDIPAGDMITGHLVEFEPDDTTLALDSSSVVSTAVVMWFSGGDVDTMIRVRSIVETQGGRTLIKSALLPIRLK